MTILRCLLSGAGTSGDGSTWDDDSDATSAYIGAQGLEAAMAAATTAGDTTYGKGASSGNSGSNIEATAISTLAAQTNPIKMIGVRTDAGDAVVQGDIILGNREGDSTLAYAQTGGEIPPTVLDTNQKINWNGAAYWYGFIFSPGDNSAVAGANGVFHTLEFEECEFAMAGGNLLLGASDNYQRLVKFTHCLFQWLAALFS